ncbi:MAG: DUF5714 domain-containing protein [Candidatus Kryptoniota bacterium]
MVCGSLLEYLENEIMLRCTYCEREFKGFIKCPNGHYVCDDCHNNQSIYLTKEICSTSDSTNPIVIFEKIIDSPRIPMLGCHHAFMAAGAFITAIKNEGTLNISEKMIEEVYNRTRRQAIGGYCGLTGICGVASALGACFAVILGSKCGKDREQRITMNAVTEIMKAITELTGPSCCKAYARKSIEVAQYFLEGNLQISLSKSTKKIICRHYKNHPHGCREEKCPYY